MTKSSIFLPLGVDNKLEGKTNKMVSKKQLADNVKNLGWDKITLTVSKGFSGAIQNYTSSSPLATRGKVALLFNMHDAYYVEDTDDNTLFTLEDLHQGIIKSRDFDIEDPASIDGAVVVAWEENGAVHFDEEELSKLGINDFSVKESIKQRLLNLAQLDFMEDLPLD